ncbi:MAG: hypothetical protein JWM91_4687 [Rhodospirillales bacterium]|nr:hypothetical protein [Rhodospirillales bacterium]
MHSDYSGQTTGLGVDFAATLLRHNRGAERQGIADQA